MSQIVSCLSSPVVGSVIGILGIVIGTILAVIFYIKGKVESKPRYSIDSTKLIDLSVGAIPASVTMEYNGEKIRCLHKTTVRFWNAGKKPIKQEDLVPNFLKIPFGNKLESDNKILSVNVDKSRSQIEVSTQTIHDEGFITFSFNFLDKGDNVCITILHTADNPPVQIEGYIVGVPNGLVNVSELQREMNETIMDTVLGTYGSITSNIINTMIKILTRIV